MVVRLLPQKLRCLRSFHRTNRLATVSLSLPVNRFLPTLRDWIRLQLLNVLRRHRTLNRCYVFLARLHLLKRTSLTRKRSRRFTVRSRMAMEG